MSLTEGNGGNEMVMPVAPMYGGGGSGFGGWGGDNGWWIILLFLFALGGWGNGFGGGYGNGQMFREDLTSKQLCLGFPAYNLVFLDFLLNFAGLQQTFSSPSAMVSQELIQQLVLDSLMLRRRRTLVNWQV